MYSTGYEEWKEQWKREIRKNDEIATDNNSFLKMGGWIKLYRQLQDWWVWKINESFDKRSTSIDIIMTANHTDKKVLFNVELIAIKRGQIFTSIRKLAECWKWSYNKCLRYEIQVSAD